MHWASRGLEGTAREGGGGVDFIPYLAALALLGAGGGRHRMVTGL